MDVERILRSIRRRQGAIALLCLSAVISVVALTYVVEERYAASALVLVRPREEIRVEGGMGRKNIFDFPLGANSPYEAPTKTFTEILKSRAVAEAIVRNLRLDTSERTPSSSAFREWSFRVKERAKEYLQTVWDTVRYGRVIEGNRFDRTVRQVQDALVVTPTLKSYVFEISCRWTSPELARRIVEQSTAVFLDVVGRLSTGEAKTVREFMDKRLGDAAGDLARSRDSLQAFKESNKSVLFTEETTEKIKTIGDLQVSLEKTEAQLVGLLREYAPGHPKVSKVEGEKESLAASIRELKRGLGTLPAKEAQLARLRLAVRTDEATYEFVKKEYEEAKIREARKSSDIGVVSPAFAPPSPVKPIKLYYAATALTMALMVGVVVAVASESLRGTLSNIEDVEQALNLPVLGTIPRMR